MKSSVVTVTLNPAIDKTVVVEKLNVGGLNRVQSVRMDPGGKGINVAKVLNQFGVRVTAAGLIAGTQGQNLLNYLSLEKIAASFLPIAGETRTNLKIVDNSSNCTTEINEAGFVVGYTEIDRFKTQLSELLNDAAYLVLSGSLPPGVGTGIYRELVELAKGKGVKTILDADDAALLEGIQAAPFAIKPNIHELEKLAGIELADDREVIRAARTILAQGIELIIVSMGSQGAIIMDKTATYRVRTEPIVPQSTVGAGDSMVAVLAYSLLNRYSLEETAQWVTAAGTVTASKPGTQVCSLAEVRQFIDKVKINRL
ncbi:MAG: 1-phosphofructokinase (fructoso 1-phosphate kinase) [Firmicutes bacterium]|nr:1-phosphofructokinase (fructoso 1-phosphate kinase) [Bacillota bacterium]